MPLNDRRAWSRFFRISKPFFTSEERRRAWGGLALLIVLLLLLSGLNVVNSYIGRDFMTAIAERNMHQYSLFALLNLGVFAALTVVSVFYQYAQDRLKLFWRQWLTQYFADRYLSAQAYYRLIRKGDIDNPDQRISQDIQTFTATTVSFALTILNSTITILAFAGVLWSITPWLLLAALGYALFGSVLTIMFGRRLIGLNNLQLKKEADLRYELIRTREYADTIALLHGEKREKTRIGGRLRSAVENYVEIIRVTRNLGFFTSPFKYLVPLIPVLIVAPRYLRGEIAFGVVIQAGMAFAQIVGQATELIVVQFQNLAEFVAVVQRLGSLWDALSEAAVPPQPALRIIEDGTRVAYDQVTLRTPKDGRLLVNKLSVQIPRGKRLLIEGSNGPGKTALFRATAGIRMDGEGRIIRPPRDQMMVLPQRPWTVPGSLRDQLLYGLPVDEVGDDHLLAALHAVKFESILERVAGLDVEHDWASTLSLEEQQLLAFARLLLADPPFALLDLSVTAFDPKRCSQLFQVLSRTAISYLTMGDHVPLREYHDIVLELHQDGQWDVEPEHDAVVV